MAKADLTAERLRELVYYDSDIGFLRWRISPANRVSPGDIAGHRRKKGGYWKVSIDSTDYLMHRLIWLYVTGVFPKLSIDHIDGNPSNNSFENLREATQSENNQNLKRAKKNNKSGFLGVSVLYGGKSFEARIKVNGEQKHIGCFATAEEAHQAYLDAKRKLHQFGTL